METSRDLGPVIERALLTAELRQLRQAAEMTQAAAARKCEWSLAKLARIENGGPVTKTDLEGMLYGCYGVTDGKRIRTLTGRARAARQPGWWEDYPRARDRGFLGLLGYEYGASSIRSSSPLTIPGLLQTPDYTAALLDAFGFPPEATREITGLFRERRILAAENVPEQTYLLDETVLTRGPEDSMPPQLRHLAGLADSGGTVIRVIPHEAGHHFGLTGPFALIGVSAPLGTVMYVEKTPLSGQLVTQDQDEGPGEGTGASSGAFNTLSDCIAGFEHLQDIALSPEDSLALIERTARHPGTAGPRRPGRPRAARAASPSR